MAKYILVDTANLFFRCLHSTKGDAYTRAGLALHILFRSVRKMWREHNADHVVFCLEGKSWRYDVYPKYKAMRKVKAKLKPIREQEDDEVFMETLAEAIDFLKNKTNATVLQADRVEGDDLIARWVQNHPEDEHLIVSGDTDFIQLLNDKVQIFDGVRSLLISTGSVLNEKGLPVKFSVKSDGKLKINGEVDLENEDYDIEDEWWKRALFMKCIRGDSGDGIFSAFPKVRETKLRAAWEDRKDQGFNWNNLMLQTWDDMGETVRVIDRYNLNKSLIDLTLQPDDVKELMDQAIIEAVSKPKVTGIGIHFLRFCEKNGLVNLTKEAKDHSVYLNAPYAS